MQIAEKKPNSNTGWLLLALSALIVIRILPILKSPLSTYGYDYGFYLDAATHANRLHFPDLFNNAIWGGYNNPLFLLAYWLRIPPAVVINELYFLASLALGLTIWLWLKTKNKLAGLFGIILVAASFVQTSGYLTYLWKNILALPILVLGFKYLEQKKYWQLAICFLGILLLHRTTAILFGLTLGIYFIVELIKQKNWRMLFGLLGVKILISLLGFHFLHLKSVILNLIYNNNYYVTTGLFMEGQNFWLIWWPFLLLALPGAYLYFKKRQHPILPIFTSILLSWIIFKLPFYRRMFLYLDVCLVVFAAYFLSQVDYSRKFMKVALGIVIAVLMIRSADYALNQRPLITPEEVSEIKNFKPKDGNGFILAVSANDASWLLAYANAGQRLGAPGLLEDPHTYQQWKDFWQNQNQRNFLSFYPQPLYFYQRSYRLQPSPLTQCLVPLSANFSQLSYTCLEKDLPNAN